jgi:hypothetical protein
MVTRHGFSCIQPTAVSLSSFLVQEPALQLLLLNTRHLYSSQACPQRSFLLDGTRVSMLVEMSDIELQSVLLPSRIPLLTPICTLLVVLYSRWNFIALQNSIHYS